MSTCLFPPSQLGSHISVDGPRACIIISVRENNAVVFAPTAVETYRKGYPEFAAFIDSSESFRLFRRFGWLRARRLLFLQHGLGKLERQLREVDQLCQDYQHARAAQSLLQPDIKAIKSGCRVHPVWRSRP